MGLDCSHDAWHGAYSSFTKWRRAIAQAAGLPPLDLMDGFYTKLNSTAAYRPPTLDIGDRDKAYEHLRWLDAQLPIRWAALAPDPLHELLNHSDCDGEIATELCGPIADRLEALLPSLPAEGPDVHSFGWRERTQTFINGLRLAASLGEAVEFR